MSSSSSTTLGAMQIRATYYPMSYTEKGLLEYMENVSLWYSPLRKRSKWYGWDDESTPAHVWEFKDYDKVLIPFVTFETDGVIGESRDSYRGFLDWEIDAIGTGDLLMEEAEKLWHIAMPKFIECKGAREKRVRKYYPQRVPLQYVRKPLDVNFGTVWSGWYSYDDYTGEADADVALEGELNTGLLDTIVRGDEAMFKADMVEKRHLVDLVNNYWGKLKDICDDVTREYSPIKCPSCHRQGEHSPYCRLNNMIELGDPLRPDGHKYKKFEIRRSVYG